MRTSWMRGAVAAALGWAMLAGVANATIVTYNFTTSISDYGDNLGNSSASGTFSGRFQIDTMKLAMTPAQSCIDPTYGYVYTFANNVPGSDAVTGTANASGTPTDSLLNSSLPAPVYASQLFQGDGKLLHRQQCRELPGVLLERKQCQPVLRREWRVRGQL